MDLKGISKTIQSFLLRYKYVLLIVFIGLVFLFLPTEQSGTEDTNAHQEKITFTESSIEEKLAEILTSVCGAGQVKVFLSEGSGSETIYQTNEDMSVSDDSSDNRSDTVTITNSNRDEQGLIRQINPPKYLGAIIVCDGADDPVIRLAIVDAVCKITGLGANSISVLKMK